MAQGWYAPATLAVFDHGAGCGASSRPTGARRAEGGSNYPLIAEPNSEHDGPKGAAGVRRAVQMIAQKANLLGVVTSFDLG